MTTRVAPICLACKYYLPDQDCTAFGTRIPDPIWQNAVDHRQPYQGDNGKQFTQDPKRPKLPHAAYDVMFAAVAKADGKADGKAKPVPYSKMRKV